MEEKERMAKLTEMISRTENPEEAWAKAQAVIEETLQMEEAKKLVQKLNYQETLMTFGFLHGLMAGRAKTGGKRNGTGKK